MAGAQLAWGQAVRISGVVTGAEDGMPMPGVSVVVKGTTTGTATDMDGRYTLSVPADAQTLVFSYIGYATQEVAIAGRTTIDVVMESGAEDIEEIVVTAYGTAKKSSLVGAATSIKAEKLESRPVTNVSNALAATTPGVQVTTSTGQPGASASIRIRGFGSVNASNAPIYVVDGAIYDGSIADISASDIQSVTLLKDAAATALYGSSAGNGVILITTKSGDNKEKGKPWFTFSMQEGMSRRGQKMYEIAGPEEHYRLRWQQWYNQYFYNQGKTAEEAGARAAVDVVDDLGSAYMPFAGIVSGYDASYQLTTDPAKIVTPAVILPNGTLNPEITGLKWGDDLDWEKALYRTGHRREYSISGGYNTDKLTSFMSAGYMKENGYTVGTSFERFTSRANVSYKVNKWIRTGVNLSMSRAHNEAPKTASGNYTSNPFSFIQRMAPIYPIHLHDADGNYVLDASGQKQYDYTSSRKYNGRFNPIYQAEIDKSYFDRDMLSDRVFLEITPIEGLKLTANASYDVINSGEKMRYNNVMGDQPQGMLYIWNDRYTSATINQLAQYNRTFADVHNFEVLVGHESYLYRAQSSMLNKDQMSILGYDEMGNFSTMKGMSSSTTDYRKEGYFARASYDFNARYYLSASFRRDGTSKFSPENRWGNFWSVGASWRIGNEAFMQEQSWVDELKLRASIGQTGNDNLLDGDGYVMYFPYMTTFSLGSYNGPSGAISLSAIGNKDLRWESQTSYDVALEFSFLNRVSGTLEFFNKESKDLLFPVPVPMSSGISSISKNIGKVRNYGLEAEVNVAILETDALRWDFNVNATMLRNKVVALPEEYRETGIVNSYTKYEEGKSLYEYYLYEYNGVDSEDGHAMYRADLEEYPGARTNFATYDILVVGNDTLTKDYRFARKHYCGSSIPKVYGGFGTSLSWKGLEASVQFAYQLGGKAYDGVYAGLMGRSMGAGAAIHVDMANAWKNPGDVTDIPRLDASTGNRYTVPSPSDRWLVSSNALMLKSASIMYTLPKQWLQSVGVASVKVGVSGENLWLLSARQGLNPFGSYSGVTTTAYYGFARTFTGVLNITF
ncbi:MAG: TonB-dependent receptor [Bacteroidales bacterium]|nr:TonB-dependent receptor [Bacteroidales bacterium]